MRPVYDFIAPKGDKLLEIYRFAGGRLGEDRVIVQWAD
jgi:hypothetical protein